MMELTINGNKIQAHEGQTILEAAREAGIDIPTLCHDPKLKPVGVCRVCVVDTGERTLAAACVRKAEANMEVKTDTPEVTSHRKTLVELLMADQPDLELDARQTSLGNNELIALATDLDAQGTQWKGKAEKPKDQSSPVIAVDHAACILCDRCIRACDDVQSNEVIGRTGKGYNARIAFDLDNAMGESTCVSCGECAAACPTGALVDKPVDLPLRPPSTLEQVDSVCPYCGVGCALTYHVDRKADKIVFAEGRDSPGNQSRLCVKGRYGWDYAKNPQRLTKPLIRRESAYPKGALSPEVRGEKRNRKKAGGLVDYDQIMPFFREATWEEALDLVANRLTGIRDQHGAQALAGFGSAKCSNEEAYLFQKWIRACWGTNNVDHCTRLCHASSVAALMEGIGSGAVTTTYGDALNAEAILITGSNATANHPVAATFFKQAHKQGTKLIVVDPRQSPLGNQADFFCQIRPGTDVAFYDALMHVIIEEDLYDQEYIEAHTENFEALREMVQPYTPEKAAPICGIPADTLREVARSFATAKGGIIFWGMGISQHVYGTNNSRCLIALALLTGNIGRTGSGLHPLRGQNNVQGASDAGLIPMVFPDYQSVEDEDIRNKFEKAWEKDLPQEKGLTVVEIMHAALSGDVKGMYIMGENPFLSDPNTNKVRKGLSNLDFLAVQDIFLTETAEFADVILPSSSYLEKLGTYTNTDRRVQIGRPVHGLPGEARLDWQIITELSTRMGYPMDYDSPEQVFTEFTSLSGSYSTLNYDHLGATGKLWPNPDPENDEGPTVLFGDGFPTPNGRAKFVPAEWTASPELPDEEYPYILTTGRVLEHWHTGSMTRRSRALHEIEPNAFVGLHPDDAASLGVIEKQFVDVESRRGKVTLQVRIDPQESPGAAFMPFHFREAAANLLTLDNLDPDGKIPEFKFCAIKISPADLSSTS